MKLLAFGVLFLSLTAAVARADSDLQQREAELLAQVKAGQTGRPLLQLAQVREAMGAYDRALATWALIKKLHGGEQAPRDSSAPAITYGKIADFWMHRLRRRQNLAANPTQMTPQLREKLAKAAMDFGDRPPMDEIVFAAQADLDGDSLDEYVFVGRSGPLGNRTKRALGIAKWDGARYRVAWQRTENVPFMIHVVDEDGDGWKELFLGFTPDTDDATRLYFNGRDVLLAWSPFS